MTEQIQDKTGKGAPASANEIEAQSRLKAYLLQHVKTIELALVRDSGLTVDRLRLMLIRAWTKSEKLQKCTLLSMLEAAIEAAALGLEPGLSVLSHAYLVPRFDKDAKLWKANLQISARGKLELARRSGLVLRADAVEIRENDHYVIRRGTDPLITHHIDLTKPRGQVLGYYAIAWFTDKSCQFDVMSLAECLEIRDRFGLTDGTAWKNSEGEMCKKTVLHRLEKLLPLSPQQQRAHDLDDESEDIVPAGTVTDITDDQPVSRSAEPPEPPKARTKTLAAAREHAEIVLQANRERDVVVVAPQNAKREKPAPGQPCRCGHDLHYRTGECAVEGCGCMAWQPPSAALEQGEVIRQRAVGLPAPIGTPIEPVDPGPCAITKNCIRPAGHEKNKKTALCEVFVARDETPIPKAMCVGCGGRDGKHKPNCPETKQPVTPVVGKDAASEPRMREPGED
jgi:recombination protein RecT